MQFTVPKQKIASKITVTTDVIPEWTMSYKEYPGSYSIEKYDDLSVTINFGNEQIGATFPIVQGMAFFTGFFRNAIPSLTTIY